MFKTLFFYSLAHWFLHFHIHPSALVFQQFSSRSHTAQDQANENDLIRAYGLRGKKKNIFLEKSCRWWFPIENLDFFTGKTRFSSHILSIHFPLNRAPSVLFTKLWKWMKFCEIEHLLSISKEKEKQERKKNLKCVEWLDHFWFHLLKKKTEVD